MIRLHSKASSVRSLDSWCCFSCSERWRIASLCVVQHAHAGCGAGSLGFGCSDAVSNMRVMALTVNAGLRLRAGEMCTVLSVSYSLFTSVVILSRCSPLFFHGCHALCFRHSHNYDNCGQSGHARSGSFRRSRNFYIRAKGIKSLLEFQLDLPRPPPEQDSELIARAPLSGTVHSGQSTYYAERTS